MGRHAAPSEDEPELDEADLPTVTLPDLGGDPREPGERPRPTPRGRHSVPDEDELEPAAEGAAQSPADEAGRPAEAKPRREGSTAADLRLLRTDPALRNRVIAAVLVPFVLLVLVLAVIGRMDAFAVWIWLPLITAGVAAGLLLDKGHARAKPATGDTEDAP